jgi:phosphatidyl-myo-inositol dimannoside synthase
VEILIITWNYPPRCGGIENVMVHLSAGLARHNKVTVITANAADRSADGKNVFRAPLPGLLAFAMYALGRGALQLLRNPAMQVVCGGSALVAPLVLLLARLFGRKAVVQVHGLDVIHESPAYQQLCVRWLKGCDQVIANSNYTKTLAEGKGVPTHLVSVIPPGVDEERFAKCDNGGIAEALGLAGKRVILFVGRLAKRKGCWSQPGGFIGAPRRCGRRNSSRNRPQGSARTGQVVRVDCRCSTQPTLSRLRFGHLTCAR